MAKSPIFDIELNTVDEDTKNKIESLKSQRDLPFSLTLKSQSEKKLNIGELNYYKCNQKLGYPTNNRQAEVKLFYKFLQRKRKDKYSDDSIYQFYVVFRPYICYCDNLNISPFSEIGYLSYLGSGGELWRLVALYESRKKDYFEYKNDEEIGLKERTAASYKRVIDQILVALNFNILPLQSSLTVFKLKNQSGTTAYTHNELSVMIRRLSYYFGSLATQLIHYHKSGNKLPPEQLKVVVDKQNNQKVYVTVGQNKGRFGPCSPLHQCMTAGYLLFCYFTAFNKTPVLELHHPVFVENYRDKTSRNCWIKAYKGRSYKSIEALFREDPSATTHPELKGTLGEEPDNEAGFIKTPMHKSDKFAIESGMDFINKLEEVSRLYSSSEYGKVFFSINSNGEEVPLHISYASNVISQNLCLLSDQRSYLAEHFIRRFKQVQNHSVCTEIFTETSGKNSLIISKIQRELHANSIKRRSIELAFAALSCMTNLPLRNIIMPLTIKENEDNPNKINVSFSYLDGKAGSFITERKFKKFLLSLERYAQTYNRLPSQYQHTNPKRKNKPAFLLPLGKRDKTYQWQSIESIISPNLVTRLGVNSGNFFLVLSSSKLRLTTSDQEYSEADRGRSARSILQNEKATLEQSYINGHPIQNKKMVSQGIQTIENIAKGNSLEESKQRVKVTNKIEVLAYDEYKELKTPTNPNGIHCDGKPEIEGEKDYHYAARKFALNNSIIHKNEDITCYQLDLCVFCSSAKLVDDPHSIYKLISFIEALRSSLSLLPTVNSRVLMKIERFELLLEQIPSNTFNKALDKRLKNGIYPLFSDEHLILNFAIGATKYDR